MSQTNTNVFSNIFLKLNFIFFTQPLQDNLEAQTYETFERDPVKYVQYQEATRRALKVTTYI